MRILTALLAFTLLTGIASAEERTRSIPQQTQAEIVLREIRYDGRLSDTEARFAVDLDLQVSGRGEAVLPLFEGQVAVLPTALPNDLRLVREGNVFQLSASREGRYRVRLDLVARITRQEPWNQVTFTGPVAAISSISAQAHGAGLDLQLLTGTQQATETKDGLTQVQGFLGAERVVSMRWQSKAAEVTRKALVTCQTRASVQVTPAVLKYATDLDYEIVQGSTSQFSISLPAAQTLTKLAGEGVRDWQTKPDGGQQILTVELIQPAEKSYRLRLLSEQSTQGAAASTPVAPPQPLEVDRESGSLAISAEDVLVETESATGLRQVNAASGELAAYEFYSRPFALALRLRRIVPVVSASDRVTVRLEEARLLVNHALTLNVEKAGIYVVELVPPSGFVVADLHSEGIEDWKAADGRLTVNFNSRVLGQRSIEVQLEQALKGVPDRIEVTPLRVVGAARQTAQIGAVGAPGIQLKTVTEGLVGARDLPIGSLSNRLDETLAYAAEQPDWKVVLSAERMAPRITADVFNLITIGDGLLGGSATIRFAILNQGVQEFRIKVPPTLKNVEFTGPNIRRKELQGDTWIIGLQEKAWGGYTLVVTYDNQFDPHKATLPIGGIHPEGVERETGSIAVTTAANLQLVAQPSGDNIRRVDPVDLDSADRSLISRPVLMAYKYQGASYGLTADATRSEEVSVLDAVADRTQLTTVLTDGGQLLTQASFMVKNNDRQFQAVRLPKGAEFWSCFVGGEPVKPEKNGDNLLVPLPRRGNRDEAFAVDVVYAQKIGSLKSMLPRRLALSAPATDMQTTYAEWELYVPQTHRLGGFGGNMIVARGTTYGVRDGWLAFLRFYDALYQQAKVFSILFIIVAGLAAVIVVSIRRGWRGLVTTVVVVGVLLLLAAMLMPALSRPRERGRTASAMSNLRQIGLGLATFAGDHGGQFPQTIDELVPNFIGDGRILIDGQSGEKFTYVGAGRSWQDGGGNIIAYSPVDMNGRNVLFNDGHVQWMTSEQFGNALSATMAEGSTAGSGRGITLAPATPQAVVGAIGSYRAIGAAPLPAGPTSPRGMRIQEHTDQGGNILMNYGLGHLWQDQPDLVTQSAGGAVPSPEALGVAPMVSGIRPIRIDIPRTGQRFVFTKVLNVGKEPLAVIAVAMRQKVFQTLQGLVQALAFIAGLALVWWQFRRAKPSSAVATLGTALVIGSIVSVLLSTRMLGVALIVGVPVLALAIVALLVWKFWRPKPKGESGPEEIGQVTTPVPPVVAAIALLLISAGVAKSAPNDPVSVLSGTYIGIVKSVDGPSAPRVVQFDATFNVESAEANQTLRLFGPDVAVEEFAGPKGGGWLSSRGAATDARLIRDGENVNVWFTRKGKWTLHAKFLVKIGGDVAKREIVFGIPPALTSHVMVTLDDPEAMVEMPQAVSFKSTASGSQTLVDAVLGASERVEMTWTPRMKQAAEMAATVFCQNASLVTFAGGVMSVKSVLDYQIPQGELREIRVAVPAGHRLMRVEGEGIRTWKLDGQTVTVDLVKGATEPSSQGGGNLTIVNAIWGSKDTWVDVTVKVTDLMAKGESSVGANTRVFGDPMPWHTKILQVTYMLDGRKQTVSVTEGDSFDVPTPKTAGASSATRGLNSNVSPGYRLVVETEMPQASPSVKVEVPHAMDVKRETGLVGLKSSEELGLTVESQDDLQKVDADDFMRAMRFDQTGPVSTAYRFMKPEFGLTVRVEPVQPQTEALVRNAVRVGTEQIDLQAMVGYTIKRAGVFALRLALPADYRVERVTGDNVSQWVEKAAAREGEPRELEVTLKERTMSDYALAVDLVRTIPELPQSILVLGVQPLGTQKLSGFVSVSSEEGVQIKSQSVDGLTEVAPEQAGAMETTPTGNALAFKIVPGGSVGPQPGWKLTLATERIQSWVRAEVVNVVSLNDTLVSGRSMVRFDIQNAPTKEFRIRVPGGFKNVEIAGANIRRKDNDTKTGEWRVELQNKVRGHYALTVTWEEPWNAKNGSLEWTGVEAPGVERETGWLAVLAPTRMEVEAKTLTPDLVKIDEQDLPDWAGLAGRSPVLAYRYLRPGYKLTIAVQRFQEAEVLQALVDSVRLMTVVSEDGQAMTDMSLMVRNNGRQNLEVSLPEGAQVWSAFVSGQPVRPGERDGKLLLPMERTEGDAAVAVELIYIGTAGFPRRSGLVGMVSPSLDVPLKNARWDLYLPPDFQYGHFEGTMKQEVEAAAGEAGKAVASFGWSEYKQAEADRGIAATAETVSSLSNARSRLAGGNLGDASQFLNRAKQGVALGDLRGNEDLKNLEKDLRREQGRNLLQAQSSFVTQNSYGQQSVQGGNKALPSMQVQLGQEAAELQVTKLQQAQELAVAKTLPLHVNLPKRGIHCSFTQVLQTEIGKPMTVQFSAVNERAMSWPTRVVASLGLFGILWVVVAIALRRKVTADAL